LLTSPIRALKTEFPGFRISVLVEQQFAGCFAANPDIDHVIVARGKYSTAAKLLAHRFDAIVNLHGGPTSFIYSCLGWGRRIGAQHFQYARFYHGLFPSPDSALHTVESTLDTFRWLGLRAEKAPPLRYASQPAEAARVHQTCKDQPYVVIHPASL